MNPDQGGFFRPEHHDMPAHIANLANFVAAPLGQLILKPFVPDALCYSRCELWRNVEPLFGAWLARPNAIENFFGTALSLPARDAFQPESISSAMKGFFVSGAGDPLFAEGRDAARILGLKLRLQA